ncbi:Asp23/Gls24 family envelope stress response protein [Aneurinibacillus tyrosinisolvens]|uniref:Asp23/Gls24 family envelope stress response protein n=1 Tax=Aneurinibacillus tyrosinisolvens TaxID=1443435 RepID=UPI00063FBCEF|nr:Asp23/Gls24 family envelope stress response protein [Aneurinibacillus tyrosinisolvens]
MSIQISTELGTIEVEEQVVATLAGAVAMECYGLIGMSSRRTMKDGIADILRRENLSRGVEVRKQDGMVLIDLYIIVSYGTKISEVAHIVQERVKYALDQQLGLAVDRVNIYVQGVREVGT